MSVPKDYIGGSLELDLSWLANPISQSLGKYFGLDGGSPLLASGRGAFGAILDDLRPGKGAVLVPDFLCGEVMLPRLEERDIEYRYYPVTPDLAIDENALLGRMDEETAAVLLINYFGLCDWRGLAGKIKAHDGRVAVILDNVQALYDRSAREWADYGFASFRKFLSVPDGGFGWGHASLGAEPAAAPSIDSGAPYIAAAALRQGFLNGTFNGKDPDEVEQAYLDLFAEASARVPTDAAAMSAFSQALIERLPLDSFARRRRDNYRYLAGALATVSPLTVIQPNLPDDAVPLALPVLAPREKRGDMIACLRERHIFCPVHWPLTDGQRRNGGAGCKELAERIVSFPVDQRYDPQRLERVVAAVTEYWQST